MRIPQSIMEEFQKKIHSFPIVEISDIPRIDLYMDQVTTFLNTALCAYQRTDHEKIFTKTMINNYIKAKILPPPEKKKYSPTHLMLLIMLIPLKSILSIKDIAVLFQPLFASMDQTETQIQVEQVYTGFLSLQKATFATMYIAETTYLPETCNHSVSFGTFDEKIQHILIVLCFAIDAHIKKLLAEYLLDSCFSAK